MAEVQTRIYSMVVAHASTALIGHRRYSNCCIPPAITGPPSPLTLLVFALPRHCLSLPSRPLGTILIATHQPWAWQRRGRTSAQPRRRRLPPPPRNRLRQPPRHGRTPSKCASPWTCCVLCFRSWMRWAAAIRRPTSSSRAAAGQARRGGPGCRALIAVPGRLAAGVAVMLPASRYMHAEAGTACPCRCAAGPHHLARAVCPSGRRQRGGGGRAGPHTAAGVGGPGRWRHACSTAHPRCGAMVPLQLRCDDAAWQAWCCCKRR